MSVHTMSDDEFLAAGDEILPEGEEQSQEEEKLEDESVENTEDNEDGEEDLEDTEDDDDSEEVADTTESNDDDSEDTDETEEEETDKESQSDGTEDDSEDDAKEDTDEDTQKPTYEELLAFRTEVTQDYKANGAMMPGIKDPKDFITALQMASNYAQKTAAIKPHMGRIKMLQNVTDDELNEMMDFKNRDPELIKKALKDANIDPLAIETDEEVKYTAKDYSISQAEVEFDDVVERLKVTPTFEKTTEVVTKVWDEKSKAAMLAEPRLIEALNEEVSMGRYDTIQGMISQNRVLGKNAEMSDLEMYQAIATHMNKATAKEEPEVPVVKEQPKPKVEDPAIKAAKQKAGVNTKKQTKKAPKKYDAAKLTDEEFEELLASGAKFL